MHPYAELAKEAVEDFLSPKENRRSRKKAYMPPEFLTKKGGVFVSIYDQDELRGCIGTFLPTKKNLAKEIAANAVSAAKDDYRFNPITKEELPNLKYEVSILSKPETVISLDQLDPKKYGIIVQSGNKTGLLLPDLSGVDEIKDQINIAAKKAGINPDKDRVELYRFTTDKYN